MVKTTLFLSIVLLFSVAFTYAQEEETMNVEEMVICTGVEERQPVGVDSVFADTVKNVYCFTKISGAADTTTISHVWYLKDEEKANVKLTVKSKAWRTWSSKAIPKEWDGTWRVDVLSETGEVLKSKKFVIESSN